MKIKYKKSYSIIFTVIFIGVIVIFSAFSCKSANNNTSYPKEVSSEEARSELNTEIPIPYYLPEKYTIIKYEILSEDQIRETISGEAFGNIIINITWSSDGIIAPVRLNTRRVAINECTGYLVENDTTNTVIWNWKPDIQKPGIFEISVTTKKSLPHDELFKIARSIQ